MLESRHPARTLIHRRRGTDQFGPFRAIVIGEQAIHRDLAEIRIAVIGFAVGIGQFHRLGDHMKAQ